MKREAKRLSRRRRPAPKPSEEQNVEISGGANIEADNVEIGGDVVGRDKITNVISVTRSAIHIGTLAIPTVPVVVAAILVTAGLVFVGVSVIGPPGPSKMTGGFNVAVAQFGQEDENGRVVPSEEGQRLSRTVFEVLREQTRAFSDIELRSQVQIWHDDLPNSEMGADIGLIADAQAAQALAGRLGADMVIYGAIDRQDDFIPRFYVTTEAKGEIDSNVTGHQALGSRPIQVNRATSLGAGTDLARRARALTYLTIGLTYDAFGRSEDSLAVYRDAETQLANWNETGEGKEVLYFFLGQAALYLSQQQEGLSQVGALRQQAQRAFENGIRSNPDYARPHVGLGSVYFLQAFDTRPLSALLGASDVLTKTFAEYNQALALAKQSADQQAEILTIYSLGTAKYLQGGAYKSDGQIDTADAAFRQAVDLIDSILASLKATNQQRLLGQAYQAQGSAYKELAKMWAEHGDSQKAAALVEQARQALDLCIALGIDSQDEVLRELIVRDQCVPQRASLDTP
jgi:tetratricopeptide (TPR) repeat protein